MEAQVLENVSPCKACHQSPGDGKFCQHCSQSVALKRITIGSIAHEAFHFFTHVGKGFPYIVKKLFLEPGRMQREYLEGIRVKHQKPFSMFLISATIVTLVLYWLNIILVNYYDAGDIKEALFFDKYMVLLLLAMVPLFSFLTRVFFHRDPHNYAEILVFSLYTISFFFLIISLVNFIKLIIPDFESRFIEIPAVLIYNAITFKNFFSEGKRWAVILKSFVCGIISFGPIARLQDYFVDNF